MKLCKKLIIIESEISDRTENPPTILFPVLDTNKRIFDKHRLCYTQGAWCNMRDG